MNSSNFDPKIPSYDSKKIYSPSEDSYFFIDTLYNFKHSLQELNPTIVFEIGPGTGIISAYLSNLLKPDSIQPIFISSDINYDCCLSTLQTSKLNSFVCDSINSSLFASLNDNFMPDLILFNPPYVPSTNIKEKDVYMKALEGGKNGNEVIYEFLDCLKKKKFIKKVVVLLLVEKQNEVNKMIEWINENIRDLKVKVISEKTVFNEYLYILCLSNCNYF